MELRKAYILALKFSDELGVRECPPKVGRGEKQGDGDQMLAFIHRDSPKSEVRCLPGNSDDSYPFSNLATRH